MSAGQHLDKNPVAPLGSRPSVPLELRYADMPERLQVTAGWNETILTESRIVTLDLEILKN